MVTAVFAKHVPTLTVPKDGEIAGLAESLLAELTSTRTGKASLKQALSVLIMGYAQLQHKLATAHSQLAEATALATLTEKIAQLEATVNKGAFGACNVDVELQKLRVQDAATREQFQQQLESLRDNIVTIQEGQAAQTAASAATKAAVAAVQQTVSEAVADGPWTTVGMDKLMARLRREGAAQPAAQVPARTPASPAQRPAPPAPPQATSPQSLYTHVRLVPDTHMEDGVPVVLPKHGTEARRTAQQLVSALDLPADSLTGAFVQRKRATVGGQGDPIALVMRLTHQAARAVLEAAREHDPALQGWYARKHLLAAAFKARAQEREERQASLRQLFSQQLAAAGADARVSFGNNNTTIYINGTPYNLPAPPPPPPPPPPGSPPRGAQAQPAT